LLSSLGAGHREACSPLLGSAVAPARAFSGSACRSNDFESPFGINSLAKLSDEEEMLREAVRRFATEVVEPKVREMDENEKMDPAIIKGLFEQGLMGIETSQDHGGAGCSFTAAIIVIEGALCLVRRRSCRGLTRSMQSSQRSTPRSRCSATCTT
jgi:hypothetical protein